MKSILILIAAVVLISVVYKQEVTSSKNSFEEFVLRYRKSYFSKQEFEFRREVFEKNLVEIEKMNKNENEQAEFGVNKFSDLTEKE